MAKLSLIAVLLAGVATTAAASVDEDITAKEREIAALRAQVEPLAKPLMVAGADLRAWVSTTPLQDAAARFNGLPEASRTITFNSTERNGYFWKNDDDWCGSFVELQGNGDLSGAGTLSAFAVAPQSDGSIDFASQVGLNARTQLHFDFMGPRVHGPFGIGNACPQEEGSGQASGPPANRGRGLLPDLLFRQ
jgi:hypothetical protein